MLGEQQVRKVTVEQHLGFSSELENRYYRRYLVCKHHIKSRPVQRDAQRHKKTTDVGEESMKPVEDISWKESPIDSDREAAIDGFVETPLRIVVSREHVHMMSQGSQFKSSIDDEPFSTTYSEIRMTDSDPELPLNRHGV